MEELHPRFRLNEFRSAAGYVGLLIGVSLVYFVIRAYGNTLQAPVALTGGGTGGFTQVHVNDFVHMMLALALVIAAARALGALFRLVHQPPVVGEMIAGVLLGPSLLGHLAPHFAAYILPQSIAPLLNVISQVGVILYMFLVGLELDVSALRDRAHSTVVISHASIVAPFLLGAGLALVLYPQLSNSAVSFTSFSLFLGVSMSVTAFPVLARILTDRRIHKTKMGVLTLACAAIDDVTAWCLLAFVVSVTQSRAGNAIPTLLMAVGFIALMLFVIRPVVVRMTHWLDGKGRISQGALAVVLLSILFSSLATETIGIHSIFGAFVLGAIIPQGSNLARELMSKLEDFVIVFLLPAFFAFTGLRTQIGLVNGSRQWLFCLLIIAVASIGKFGGSAIAARLSGLQWRDASAIGVLMNTRGLMELIVLNIGLELHVISPTLFAMLVLMALATTLATTPILHFIMPRRKIEAEANAIEEAARLADAINDRSGTLIPISGVAGIPALLDVALSLTPSDAPPPRVLALNRGSLTGVGAKVRELETFSPSRSLALAAALDAAWSRQVAITPEAVWTTDAASEIILATEKTNVRWLVLESRRSLFGRYPRRSVISKVLEHLASRPVNIAVLLQSSSPQMRPVTCIVHGENDGVAALELASRMTRGTGETMSIIALLPNEPNPSSSRKEAKQLQWLETSSNGQPLVTLRSSELTTRLPKGLLIVAKDVANEWTGAIEVTTEQRSVILVQGTHQQVAENEQPSVALRALSAHA